MEKYPKKITLRNTTRVIIRPPKSEEIEDLFNFYSYIPKSDLLIFKEDVSKWENIESWFTSDKYTKILQLITLREDEIIANGTLHKEGLYLQDAAEIKLIVKPENRGIGLGSKIFNILLSEVFERKLQKVIVRFASDNMSFKRIIDHYGFKPETVLRCYIQEEQTKEKKDLVVASFNLEDWTRRFQFYNFLIKRF